MSDLIIKNLQNLHLTSLERDVEALCKSGPDFASLNQALRYAASQLQHQTKLTPKQRGLVLKAAQRGFQHFQPLPKPDAAKFCETLYSFVYTCSAKDELSELAALCSHLARLVPGGPAEAPDTPWLAIMASVLLRVGPRATPLSAAASLVLDGLRAMLLSRPTDQKLAAAVFNVTEWGRSPASAAAAPALLQGLLTLATLAPLAQREQLALSAARLCPAADCASLVAKLGPLWEEAPPTVRLVTAVMETVAGRAAALTAAAGALKQLQVPAARDELAAEALYAVYRILLPLTGANSTAKVSTELAAVACDAAALLAVCPLPAHIPAIVTGRACNCAHTLLVEAVRDTSATPRLVAAGVHMLREMVGLSGRLSAANPAWFSTVLVTVSGNLGVVVHRAGQEEEAVDVLTMYLDSASAADPASLNPSSVASKVQFLSELHRSRQQFASGLRALARAIPLAPDHRAQLVTSWAKVKRDALRRQNTECLGSTIPSVMREAGVDPSRTAGGADDTARLLKLEINHYLMVSSELGPGVEAALRELGSVPDLAPADRAWLLVMRARTGATAPQQAVDDCLKAVSLLSDLLAEDAGTPLALDLCVANYQLCLSRKLVEMEAAKLSPLTRLTQGPVEPDDEVDLDASCTVVPDYLTLNLGREAASLRPLRQTLSLADRLLQQGVTESEGFSSADLLSAVEGTAQLYEGLGYRLQAARAWRLTLTAAQKLADHARTVTAGCRLLELDLWPEEADLAAVAAAAEAVAARTGAGRLVTLLWTVGRAWRCYHRHQVREALLLLDPVLTSSLLLTRNAAHFRVAADAHRLASLCSCAAPAAGRNGVELAALAAFHALCVKTWITDDKIDCLAEHISWLGFAADTVRHVAHVLVRMHCPREVRSHVREQLESAHGAAAALRTAQFLSLLVEADLLCEDADDTQVKLDTLRHILLDPAAGAPRKSRQQSKTVRQRAAAARLRVPAGAAGDSPAPPEPGRDLLSAPAPVGTPIARDARWLSRQPRCTSPSLRRPPLAAPPSLQHPADCSCDGCGCPEGLTLTLRLALQTARAVSLGDDVSGAIMCYHTADGMCDALEEKVRCAAGATLGQLPTPAQLSSLLQLLREERCRGRLQLAQLCSWSARHQLAAEANQRALQLLRQLPDSEQFVSRHVYLLTEIWNQRSLIDASLAEEKDQVTVDTLRVSRELTVDVGSGSDAEPVISPGRLTPTQETAAADAEPAAPPRRRAKREQRARTSLGSGQQPEPATPPSPKLVRSTRRRAAAVKQEIQQCAPARSKLRTRSRTTRAGDR